MRITGGYISFNPCLPGESTCRKQMALNFINAAETETANLYTQLNCSKVTGAILTGVYSPKPEGQGSCLNWAGINALIPQAVEYLGDAYYSGSGKNNDVQALTQIDQNTVNINNIVEWTMVLYQDTYLRKSCY